MANDLEVPTELFSAIPDDADEQTKLYMRAQTVIQSAFYSLGDRDLAPGEATMENGELQQIIAAALGMMVAIDGNLKTKRDVRLHVEDLTKYIRGFADLLRDTYDQQPSLILDLLRMRRSSPSTN